MILFKRANDLSLYLQAQSQTGQRIGFVPTMGAIHEGHASLLATSRQNDALTVCSVFVNPTQFNNRNDFEHYPVTPEKDIERIAATGCHALFVPDAKEIYPAGYVAPKYNLGHLETVLEGAYRPGHFQGVCQVVDRLLQLVNPNRLYLGQKDYQQCMVIQRLLAVTHRSHQTSIVVHPTLREPDGLAMSSRNLRLTPEQRSKAPCLYQALEAAKKSFGNRSTEAIKHTAVAQLASAGFKVDYFEIASADTLLPASDASGDCVALTAAWLGDVRLIDNLPLTTSE